MFTIKLKKWRPFINVNNEICVFGYDSSNVTVKSDDIVERLSPQQVIDSKGLTYYLKDIIHDNRNTPTYIEEVFRFGFPCNWKYIKNFWIVYINTNNPEKFQWPILPSDKDEDFACSVYSNRNSRNSFNSSIETVIDDNYNKSMQSLDKIFNEIAKKYEQNFQEEMIQSLRKHTSMFQDEVKHALKQIYQVDKQHQMIQCDLPLTDQNKNLPKQYKENVRSPSPETFGIPKKRITDNILEKLKARSDLQERTKYISKKRRIDTSSDPHLQEIEIFEEIRKHDENTFNISGKTEKENNTNNNFNKSQSNSKRNYSDNTDSGNKMKTSKNLNNSTNVEEHIETVKNKGNSLGNTEVKNDTVIKMNKSSSNKSQYAFTKDKKASSLSNSKKKTIYVYDDINSSDGELEDLFKLPSTPKSTRIKDQQTSTPYRCPLFNKPTNITRFVRDVQSDGKVKYKLVPPDSDTNTKEIRLETSCSESIFDVPNTNNMTKVLEKKCPDKNADPVAVSSRGRIRCSPLQYWNGERMEEVVQSVSKLHKNENSIARSTSDNPKPKARTDIRLRSKNL